MSTVTHGFQGPKVPGLRKTVAASPVQRGDRKMGCGAPKRKLRWPLLPWGRKLPATTITTRAGGLERRGLLSCTGFLPSTKEWVGVSAAPPACGPAAAAQSGLCVGQPGGCPSQGGRPGTHFWDLAISHAGSPFFCPWGWGHIVPGPFRAWF